MQRMPGMAVVAMAMAALFSVPAFAEEHQAPAQKKVGLLERLLALPSWEKAVASVDSPKRAAKLVRQNIRFREDLGDEWADGRTTWNRGFGDCEDFAAAVTELCKDAGVAADASIQVFSVEGFERHAVAVGTWKGRIWISSNGWFEYADSMDHAKELVANEMNWNEVASVTITPLRKAGRGERVVAADTASMHE